MEEAITKLVVQSFKKLGWKSRVLNNGIIESEYQPYEVLVDTHVSPNKVEVYYCDDDSGNPTSLTVSTCSPNFTDDFIRVIKELEPKLEPWL